MTHAIYRQLLSRLVFAGGMCAATPIDSAELPNSYLFCQGYNYEFERPVHHHVIIYSQTATIDNVRYSMAQAPDRFILRGPLPGGSELIRIDRVTGDYFWIDGDATASGKLLESARGRGGCKQVKRRR